MFGLVGAPRTRITTHTLRYLRHALTPQQSPLQWCRLASTSAQSYYDLFPLTVPSGPPPAGSFKIDNRKLRNEFLQLQARAHPDRHPQERKTQAEALSSRINNAYKTLSDPLLRAQYLLSLHYGTDVSSDEAAKLDGGDSQQGEDAELLMTVMEAREVIEDAESEDQLLSVRKENDERVSNTVRILEKAFDEGDWETARQETVRLRYWVGIGESIKEWVSKK